ncbi:MULTISPECIES: choline BCCT transporter BetT [unclassified Modestobacter]|uniref:choline BCCT transporter BetT n=1 Tax=unclassified Modestobacter TaxID=2643866 RepID=UPI0022AB1E1A|nr:MULTISPECIES: choline BCCT transporter BetT [unclassified Modestobacter]MCZ2824511.1 choline BCCT transporter BetT [Modestobacter sp. VKM Ac-2981]MCZ2853961.1 choline BCCT transporter BetT [Modestobacter sp. VKM Ac-2982]
MSEQTVAAEGSTTAGPSARIKKPVFYGSAAGVLIVAGWAIAAPTAAADAIGTLVGWTSEWFGWFYILLATAVLVFVIFLGVSRYGRTKLGPEHSTPQYSTFAWASMLFAAGIGTDLMFFAVAEPVTQYLAPPVGEPETVEAAREATVWTLFHYGITGWGMYALMGMALAYFSYRMNLPLAIRSALYPIFGKRINGALGHTVDMAAVLGTIFGVATSLGIGVVQLNYGLDVLVGIPEGRAAQVGLIALAVGIATISAVSGIDKGIKLLSQLNVLLAIGLAAFVLIAGNTVFLLNALVLNIGDFVSTFGDLTLQTFAFDRPVDWLNGWTLFFWAWWIAWASFVGLFLARISRGRTIRQFVAGTMIIPFTYILMWVSIFGNSALDRVRGGDEAFGELAMNTPERGFYTLLMDYPVFPLTAAVATFVGLLFYVTSADSGALVMANLSSELRTPQDDAGTSVRIFWAVATGLLTAGMLIVGGVPALQNATIIMGLPFAFVMVLVMVSLYKALRVEANRTASHAQSLPGRLSGRTPVAGDRRGGRTWRTRLSRAMSFPDKARIDQFLDEVAEPALEEVATELRAEGVETEVRRGTDELGQTYVQLVADLRGDYPFAYRVQPAEVPMPVYGPASPRGDDTYFRLEVHMREGGQGYDIMGYTHTQIIDDVLDQYERHLEFLRLQSSGTTS